MSYRAKDSLVHERQLAVQQLHLKADLVAGSSEDPAICSVDNSTITATVVSVDVKEDVKKIVKVQIVEDATGQSKEIASAAINGQAIDITLDASLTDGVCVSVHYEVE